MKDWKKKIEDSAKDIDVPDSLRPEAIENMLGELPARKKVPFYRKPLVQFAAAAVIVLGVGIGIRASGLWTVSQSGSTEMSTASHAVQGSGQTTEEGTDATAADMAVGEGTDATAENADAGAATAADEAIGEATADGTAEDADSDGGNAEEEDNVNISGYYYTGSYEEMKDIVKESLKTYSGCGVLEDSAAADTGGVEESASSGTGAESNMVSGSDYSETNLQVEGVDEGDSIKTDGTYIYVLTDEIVKIVDTKEMKLVAEIAQNPEDDFQINEMYVDGKQLILVGTMFLHNLEETEDSVYALHKRSQTVMQVYDISDMTDIKKTGEIQQDGYYRTSRKIDHIVYLFSDYEPYGADTDSEDGLLPMVNGAVLAEDAIYIPRDGQGSRYLIMSAVNVKNAAKMIDQKSILNSGNQFYITKNSVYVIQMDYGSQGISTVPIRFELKNGKMKACAAASLRGELTDTFAIYESDGYLKVLLTDWSSGGNSGTSPANRVYVLDENMQIIGKLSNIAPGETIYSARFVGNLGYFVTYRNIDPLFTVDFSEPSDPQIVGELKVTGFSDYLHFYSDDLLLGLGWETDPDSGETIGLKLSMYDVSNPAKVKEKHKLILKNVNYCEAVSNYKAILVNPENNLIGFSFEYSGQGGNDRDFHYAVFSYDETEGFVKEMDYGKKELTISDSWGYFLRGLFIKDSFYLVDTKQVTVFDRKNNFKETGSLALFE